MNDLEVFENTFIGILNRINQQLNNDAVENTEATQLLAIMEYVKGGLELNNEEINFLISSILVNIESKQEKLLEDFPRLNVWVALKTIQNLSESQNTMMSYFILLSKFEDLQNIVRNTNLIATLFPPEKKALYLELLGHFSFDEEFYSISLTEQKRRIYLYFYITMMAYDRSSNLEIIHNTLLPVLNKAIELDMDELVMFLHMPTMFPASSLSKTAEDSKHINDVIEKPIEKYISEKVIPKYAIKQNNNVFNKSKEKIKIVFLLERIIKYSVGTVIYSLLSNLTKNQNDKYEFIILNLNYVEFGGSQKDLVEKYKSLGLRYIDCQEKFSNVEHPLYSIMEKTLNIRKWLIKENIDILIGMNTRVEYNLLFSMRTCPKQIYWSHGGSEYNIDGIDIRINHGNLGFEKKIISGFEFLCFNTPMDREHLNPDIEVDLISQERLKYPQDMIIFGTIGRLIKLESQEYLETVIKLMQIHPKTIYIACGPGDTKRIKSIINKINPQLIDRFYFTGYVDTHIYGHIIDIWLDTFPVRQGNSRVEVATKGTPVVVLANKGEHRIDKSFVDEVRKYYKEYPYDVHNKTIEEYINFVNELIYNKDFFTYWSEHDRKSYQKVYINNSIESFYKILENIK